MIASAWRALDSGYRKLTQRERAFAAALLALVMLFTAQSSFDWAVRAAAAEARAQSRASDANALASMLSDEGLQDDLGRETGRIWRASFVDASLAGAQAQAVLAAEALAAQAALSEPEIAVADMEGHTAESAVHAVEVSLSAPFDWQAVIALMRALETAEPVFALRSVSLRADDEDRALRVVLRAPVLIEAPE